MQNCSDSRTPHLSIHPIKHGCFFSTKSPIKVPKCINIWDKGGQFLQISGLCPIF